ncbi:MAG: hypothetical protein JXR49_23080 [Acidobacteria bacterium]|nr:hypothetical protein [Acidobacteriota bacterium]
MPECRIQQIVQRNPGRTGSYGLQVIVLDMLAKEKHRMAVQSIDFEVQGPRLATVEPIK